MMIGNQVPGGLDVIERLLAVLSDPRTVKDHLDTIRTTEDGFRKTVKTQRAEIAKEQGDLAARETALEAASADLDQRKAALAIDVLAHQGREADLHNERAAFETERDDHHKAHEKNRAEFTAAMIAHNAKVSSENASLVTRARDLNAMETRLTAKEHDIVGREAAAKELQARYEIRLAKMKEAIA